MAGQAETGDPVGRRTSIDQFRTLVDHEDDCKVIAVRSDLSDDDVYKLTKTFFDSLDKLGNAHQAATEISLEAAQEGMVAPVHPGAQKYYDEK